MRFTEELQQKKFTKFSHSFGLNDNFQDESFGGIIHNGKYGWLARGPQFEVYSMKNGQKISNFRFDYNLGFEHAIITSISEIESLNFNDCILAIAIQFGDLPGGCISIYSVQCSKILRCIEIPEKVTCCHYINNGITRRTILQMMEGCLAVGTDSGKIILLDLNLSKCKNALYLTDSIEDHISLIPCDLVESRLELSHIRQRFKLSIKKNINFGIELKVIENQAIVLSLLSILPCLALVAGLEDGRMVIYDLSELHTLHLAYPPKDSSPLVKLDYLEPPDDPKACIYIWAFHENPEISGAVMHCLMYDKKYLDDECFLYGEFQSCNVRLTLPIYDMKSIPISCHSLTKLPSHGNEETISLCLLSCKSMEHNTQIFIFDLNQWYKEEMPVIGDWRRNLTYLAVFTLKHCQPFDTYIDINTIASFNSIQRCEEHFYPIALSFDFTMLLAQGSGLLHWPGLQNRTLDLLNSVGSTVLLEPSQYFHEIMRAYLMPQFCDYNYNSTFSNNLQREIILSVALEYNCFGILKECSNFWADGSHLGRDPMDGLALSTLTEWSWKRAGQIKERCNLLSVPLFDHSGILLDQLSQKELFYLTRQLKLLSELLQIILTKSNIPTEIKEMLDCQHESVKMAYEYQELLLWLLNVGLLPEPSPNSIDSYIHGVKYPYNTLKKYYQNRRSKFYKLNNSTLSTRTKTCRILYIDSFIEHECNPNVLREQWLEEGNSNGLYPPPSLQALLRTLLVPEISLQNKYILFIYLFLDLNMCAMENEKSTEIVQNLIKFPAVFKLNASVIKTVQAFWNLDHEEFEIALDEIISPFSQDKKLKQWQQELLIESLLIQQQPHLALRALQARTSPINSLLELKTLMTNNLISDAFHLARLKCDDDLMKTFLSGCIYLGKWEVLRDLALTEKETNLVSEVLKSSKSEKAGNLHFLLLLEKEKYIEALQFLEEMSVKKSGSGDMETSKLILQAYNITMTPASKNLSEIYYKNREKLDLSAKKYHNGDMDNFEHYNIKQSTIPSFPLSCQFLNQKSFNSISGIYETSALSIDCATNYWDNCSPSLLKSQNVPFIRNPQLELFIETNGDIVSYPEQYKTVQKRIREENFESGSDPCRINENPLKKRKIVEEPLNKTRILKSMNTSVLTRFKPKTNSVFELEKTIKQNSINRKETPEYDENMVLRTPVVKSSVRIIANNDTYDFTERNGNRHSILKSTAHEELSVLKNYIEILPFSKEMEEEKSIHFDLPSKDSSVHSTSSSDHEPEEEPILVKHTSTAHKHDSREGITCRYDCPQRRRSIHSLNSSIVSGVSLDEFFSPISSQNTTQNNSQIEERELIQKTPIRKEISKDSGAYVNMSSGGSTSATTTISSSRSPLYKPISRRAISKSKTPEPYIPEPILDIGHKEMLKKSRRSRSKTPEITMSPTRRSSRITALRNSPSKSDVFNSSINRAISLTRQVLESNALKNVEHNKDFLIASVQSETSNLNDDLPKNLTVYDEYEIQKTEPSINMLYNENFKANESNLEITNLNKPLFNESFSESTTIDGQLSCIETDEANKSKSSLSDVIMVDESSNQNQCSPYLDTINNDEYDQNTNILSYNIVKGDFDEVKIISSEIVQNVETEKRASNLPGIDVEESTEFCYYDDDGEVFTTEQVGMSEYKHVEQDETIEHQSSSFELNYSNSCKAENVNANENYVINISSSSSESETTQQKVSNLLYDDIDIDTYEDSNSNINYFDFKRNRNVSDEDKSNSNSNSLDLFNSTNKSTLRTFDFEYIPSKPINVEKDEEEIEVELTDKIENSTSDEALNLNIGDSSVESSCSVVNIVHVNENLTKCMKEKDIDSYNNPSSEESHSNATIIYENQNEEINIEANTQYKEKNSTIEEVLVKTQSKENLLFETTLQGNENSQASFEIQNKNKKFNEINKTLIILNLEEQADLPFKHNLRSRGKRAQSVGLDESNSYKDISFIDSPSTRRKLRATSVPKTESNTPKKSKVASNSKIERTRRQSTSLKRIEENSELLDDLTQSKRIRKSRDLNKSEEDLLAIVGTSKMTTRRRLSVDSSGSLNTQKTVGNARRASVSSEENIGSKRVSGKTSKTNETTDSTQVLQEAALNIEKKHTGKRVAPKNLKAVATAESQASTATSTSKGTSKSKRRISESSVSREEVIKEEMFVEKREVSKTSESETSDLIINEPTVITKKILKRRKTTDTDKPTDEELNLANRRLTRNQHKMLEKSAAIAEDKILSTKIIKAKSTRDSQSPSKTESETESVSSVNKNKVGKKRISKSEDRSQSPFKLESENESVVSSNFKKKGPKRRTSKSNDDLSNKMDDDTESIASEKSKTSNVSSSRITSRNRSSKNDKIDPENAASSFDTSSRKKITKSESTTKKDDSLGIILEEDEHEKNFQGDLDEEIDDDNLSNVSSNENMKATKRKKNKPTKKRK